MPRHCQAVIEHLGVIREEIESPADERAEKGMRQKKVQEVAENTR
jgi:hypothetical protein